jgi:uncharacterized protein YlxP (DUF503 family)
MHVALLRTELRLGGCTGLGAKRRLVRAIFDNLRRNYNVSAAEVDLFDRSDATLLGFAAVGRSRHETRLMLKRVADALNSHPDAELLGQAIDDL